MLASEIPQEIVDFLDRRAGKAHSREGQVLNTLAEILTIYDFLKVLQIPDVQTDEDAEKEGTQ